MKRILITAAVLLMTLTASLTAKAEIATGYPNATHEAAMTWALAQTDAGITYSMYGARDGSDGTMDCSGFVLEALRQVGVDVPLTNTVGMLWRTDSYGGSVFTQVPLESAKKGTIVVAGGLDGNGAGGHVFFLLEDYRGVDTPVLECSYAYNGIATVNTFWYSSMYLDEPVALVVAE